MKKIIIFIPFFLFSELLCAEQFWDYMSQEWESVERWHEQNDSSSFHSKDDILRMKEVEVNGIYYVDVRLKLDTSGQYSVTHFRKKLSDTESEMLRKIKSRNCGLVDTLGRLSAHNASTKAKEILRSINNGVSSSEFQVHYEDVTYCLVSKPISFTDPGFVFRYLFIKNGAIQLIADTRGDSYTSKLFGITEFTDTKFGLIENGIFIEKTIADINFEKDYVLQLIKEETVTYF